MTVVMAVPAMAVMVVAHVDDDLGVGRRGERCGENESEQAVQNSFHT
jgi:hypothetical protein